MMLSSLHKLMRNVVGISRTQTPYAYVLGMH